MDVPSPHERATHLGRSFGSRERALWKDSLARQQFEEVRLERQQAGPTALTS